MALRDDAAPSPWPRLDAGQVARSASRAAQVRMCAPRGSWRNLASVRRPQRADGSARPGRENEPRPRRRAHEAVGHVRLHQRDEGFARAVHRDHEVGVEFPQFVERLPLILERVRSEVKAAENGVHFVDAGHAHGGAHRVDDAAVPARCHHHQPASFDVVRGRQLMLEVVGHERQIALGLQKPLGRAAKRALHADRHARRRQHALERLAGDGAGGEAVVGEHRRSLGESHGQPGAADRLAVERSEAARFARHVQLARAEAFLAAEMQRQPGLELAPVGLEKTDHAAEVVVVPVAECQRVEFRRVDAGQQQVVQQCLGRVAEVDQHLARLGAARRLHVQRQSPFVLQRAPRRRTRRDREAEPLHLQGADRAARLEGVVVRIGHHADRQTIDDRHLRGGVDRLRLGHASAEHATGNHRSQRTGPCAKQAPPFETREVRRVVTIDGQIGHGVPPARC